MNPLLINGFKFDLRIYVAITSFKPLRIYIYKEGLTRFASEQYEKKGSIFSHLTNYSINKHYKKAGGEEENEEEKDHAIKWTLTQLNEYL